MPTASPDPERATARKGALSPSASSTGEEGAPRRPALASMPGGAPRFREAWLAFDLGLGLTSDLLPVPQPHVPPSPRSKVTQPGKVPGLIRNGFASGFPAWTTHTTTGEEIERWSKDDRLGVSVQMREARGVDIDLDDPSFAQEIEDFVVATLGVVLPCRTRPNSGKRLLLVRVTGEHRWRPVKVAGGMIEFLGHGRQAVIAGQHPSGVDYEWRGGLPADVPEVSVEAFEAMIEAVNQRYGTEELPPSGKVALRRLEASVPMEDPLADFIEESGLVLSYRGDGGFNVTCPWAETDHTTPTAEDAAVYWPAGTQGYLRGAWRCVHSHCEHRTVADYEAAIGAVAHEFNELVGELDDPATDGKAAVQVFDRANLTLLAEAALRKLWCVNGAATLLRTGGAWFAWNGCCYDEIGEEQLRSDLWRFLSAVFVTAKASKANPNPAPVPLNPTRDYVSNVADALRSVAEQRSARAPCWLPGAAGPDPADLIPLADGVLHVAARQLLPHSPALFTLNSLPYSWGEADDAPTAWLQFIDQVWPGDAEAREALQEIFGYLLTADTSHQKMFMLTGPRRSGKGTIGRVLTALVGQHNICSPTMASLAGEFGLEPTIGKLVALIPDARVDGVPNVQAMAEKLLMLSGEDTMSINRKNKSFWTGRPTARVFMLANFPPRLGDASGALPGRFIHLETAQSFYGHEDRGLESRLLRELPAIFRWALDGRDRLRERGFFRQPDSGLDAADEMEEMGSPVAQFVAECCSLDPLAGEATDHLFEAWRDWCGRTGHMPGAKETFGRSLRAAVPQLRKSRSRSLGRRAAYNGIALKSEIRSRLLIWEDLA